MAYLIVFAICMVLGSIIPEEVHIPKDPNDMTEDERVAEMGKPRLGDISKVEVNIRESEDFKVSQQCM